MLSQIDLKHFKCFRHIQLPVGPLTLLSGTNASGKSSLLQSLVLLNQTCIEHEWSTRLQLNGPQLRLGRPRDIIDKVHGEADFEIGLTSDETRVSWVFHADRDESELSAAVKEVRVNKDEWKDPRRLRYLLPEESDAARPIADVLRRLTYLTAERVGPRDYYDLEDPATLQVVGPRGENSVGLLFQRREQHVLSSLQIDAPPVLRHQVNLRMRQFFPESSLEVRPVPHTNLVTLGIRTSDATDFHRPVHVGFGLTQVFPIIVAILTAAPNDLLLIENPEVHLHPAGQARMGQFLAEAANAGVQIIVETHSDHVLNGIRRAVKSAQLPCEQVALHFFQARDEQVQQVVSPVIGPDGRIDHWPAGFFDQYDRDLNYFADWGT